MRLKPLGDRVVLKSIKSEEITASGILMSAGREEKPDYAQIVEIAKGLENSELKIGDKVIYSKFAGNTVKDKDEELIVIKVEDILAIVID
ncbi:MAG: co-chaperone GroES [Tissierellia bacterium]|nr:co-chaperone GroES [Tissierellia bacterium]